MKEDQQNDFSEQKRIHHSEFKAIRKQFRENIYVKNRRFTPAASSNLSAPKLQELQSSQIIEYESLQNNLNIFDEMREKQIRKIIEIPIQELSLENALEKIHSNESLDVHFGTIILRRLLVYNDGEEDLIQTIIDSGTIPRLIQLFKRDDNPHLRYECSWIMLNLSSISEQISQKLFNYQVHSSFINALERNEEYLNFNLIATIGNLVTSGILIRNACVEYGLIYKLINFAQLNFDKPPKLSLIVWAMGNIIRSKAQLEFKEAIPALKFMCKALHLNFYDSQPSYARDIFSSFLCFSNSQAYQLYDQQKIFIETIEFSNKYWYHPHFREPLYLAACLLARVSSETKYMQRMVCSSLFELCQKACKNTMDVRCLKEYLFFISNLYTLEREITDTMIENQYLFTILLKILRESEISMKIQVIHLIGNASLSSNPKLMVRYIMQYQILQDFAECLLNTQDPNFLKILLNNLQKIFRMAETPEAISSLMQYTQNQASIQIKKKNPMFLRFLTIPNIPARLQQLQQFEDGFVQLWLSSILIIFKRDGWQHDQVQVLEI